MKKIIIIVIPIIFLVGISFLVFDQDYKRVRTSFNEAAGTNIPSLLNDFYPNLKGKVGWIIQTDEDPTQVTKRIFDVVLEEHQIFDPDFMVEVFVEGLHLPTTFTFVGDNILVLEKEGKVRFVKNGILQESPVLELEVNSDVERGLLGITSVNEIVYLYFTQDDPTKGITQNYIYKYRWDGERLLEPQLLNVLPGQSDVHNGGAMVADHDGNVYAVIGDQNANDSGPEDFRILQNFPNGEADDTGVIIRVGFDQAEVKPKFSSKQIDHYYAIGIRNGFGLAIDPLTGNLWDTENGTDEFDEINLVHPKFNSGWAKILGPATKNQISELPEFYNFTYSDPEFSWENTVAPTGLVFVNSVPFQKYQGSLFVGDCNFGNLYKFSLNEERNGFVFNDPKLTDLVVNSKPDDEGRKSLESMEEILFGKIFGCITDLEFGPDGFLYVVSITGGTIYKILPTG